MISYYGNLETYLYIKFNLYFEFRLELYNPKYLAKLKIAFDLADSVNSLNSFKKAKEAFESLPHSDCPDETRLNMIIRRKGRQYESS